MRRPTPFVSLSLCALFSIFGSLATCEALTPLSLIDIKKGLATVKDTDIDATELLQDYALNVNGLIEIPAGTYIISKTIVIDVSETGFRGLRGAGGATRILMKGAGPAFRIVGDHQGTADPNSIEAHTWNAERFPVISELEIVGMHAEADGIALYRTMQCTIQNVSIRDCRYGIHLQERNRNFVLANSHIYNGIDSGVFMDHCNLHQVNFIGNHISYNKRAGIRQLNGDVHNIQITGNDIEYNWGSEETSAEILLEAPEGIISEYTISSNTIQAVAENSGANIYIVGAANETPYSARLFAITGNVIGSRNKNIYIDNASHVSITGNTIYGGADVNTHIQNSQSVVLNSNTIGTRPSTNWGGTKYKNGLLFENTRDSIVNGNIMNGHLSGSAETGGSITARACRDMRISENQVLSPLFRGIHIIDGEACVVSDNTVTKGDTASIVPSIAVTGSGNGHVVKDNIIRSTHPSPIESERQGVTVVDNIIQVITHTVVAEVTVVP